MKDYPIYKYLIQFSNIVDANGNYLEHAEAEYNEREEVKRNEDK